MQKSHLPMQQHRLSKTEAKQKSPLSSASENQTYPYSTQTEAFRETDVWVEHSQWCPRALFAPARIGEGARQQQPTRLWKISGSATLALFQADGFDSHSKGLLL